MIKLDTIVTFSALEALRNALYKFDLLTYLLTITDKTAKLAIASSTQSTLHYMSGAAAAHCSAVAGRLKSLNFTYTKIQ